MSDSKKSDSKDVSSYEVLKNRMIIECPSHVTRILHYECIMNAILNTYVWHMTNDTYDMYTMIMTDCLFVNPANSEIAGNVT